MCTGIDFGRTPAATIAERTLRGQWPVRRGLVTADMRAVRFGEVLRRVLNERYKGFTFAKITGDPAGGVRAHANEVGFSEGRSIEWTLEPFAEMNVATPPEQFEQGKWGVHRYLSH